MPVTRIGPAAPLVGMAGLIVLLACAHAAAEPPFVSPDEQAGLPAVTEASYREHETSFDLWPHDLSRSPSPWGEGSGLRGDLAAVHVITTPRRLDFSSPQREKSPRTPLTPGPSPQGEGGEVTSLCVSSFSDFLFATAGDLPPVVRGQSPEFAPIPLASGDVPVETTSLLRTITGTKGRLRGDYLTDFDNTDRIGVHLLTQSWLNFGLDTEANYWQRPVANVGREPLWTGDLNLTYNMIPHPRFKFRSGAGAAWTLEDGDAHAGYNVTHGLDVYLLWRFMATAEADWGKIDDDKLFRYRLALGLTFKFAEFYTGYESYKLGDERLDGWVNGVSIWY